VRRVNGSLAFACSGLGGAVESPAGAENSAQSSRQQNGERGLPTIEGVSVFPGRGCAAGIPLRAQTLASPKTLMAKWTQLSTVPGRELQYARNLERPIAFVIAQSLRCSVLSSSQIL
jgi:hypothetical protein